MNILVVNDDGYTSKGLEILKNAASKIGKVYVVAPHIEQSAKSASISIRQGLALHEHGNDVYSIEGTPSDCIKYALYGLNLDIDLVVSGINKGYNLGVDTIYSGTVGACMEALMNGKKAIAFSSDLDDFQNAASTIDDVFNFILKNDLISEQYMLNVNFHKKEFKEPKGIEITDLGLRKFSHRYETKDGKHYPMRDFLDFDFSKKTDLWAKKNGYISITPLKVGNGDPILVDMLNKKVNN